MSNHNYSQYSNNKKKKNSNKPKIEVDESVTTVEAPVEPAEIKMESAPVVEPIVVNETVDTVTMPKTVTGTVVNCSKLNVRSKPTTDAEVITTLEVKSEVVIDPARSTTDWLKITTPTGVDGYCMRKFVSAKL